MINDQYLYVNLQKELPVLTKAVDLGFIGNDGEKMDAWRLHFNNLSDDTAMYREVKFIIQQLMIADIPEKKRLDLMNEVLLVAQRLVIRLHQLYRNQAGFLDEEQQRALDKVLSVYYLGILFYHSVWQRLASQLNTQAERTTFSSLLSFGKNVDNSSNEIVKRCVYSMMALLSLALQEKHIGYRSNTQVIWQYLNACYRFAMSYGWQKTTYNYTQLLNLKNPCTLQALYHHCLMLEAINPYAFRRPDLLAIHTVLEIWEPYLLVTNEILDQPYLFINLLDNNPPMLLDATTSFNPFDRNTECLFIYLKPTMEKLQQVIDSPPKNSFEIVRERLCRLVLKNLQNRLQQNIDFERIHGKCQIAVGFHQIHYFLSGKTSLANLLHSHLLPERLRPTIHSSTDFGNPIHVHVVGKSPNHRKLHWRFGYESDPNVEISPHSRMASHSTISQFQVQSLLALLIENKRREPVWKLAKVECIRQQPDDISVNPQNDVQHISLNIEAHVQILATGIVPCGVRITTLENRPPQFMHALIIPQNASKGRPKTSLMMARFGYKVDDKLIVRIDTKEVNIQLTELLNITDDVEEYAFVRLY